jgi:hypothetical protein
LERSQQKQVSSIIDKAACLINLFENRPLASRFLIKKPVAFKSSNNRLFVSVYNHASVLSVVSVLWRSAIRARNSSIIDLGEATAAGVAAGLETGLETGEDVVTDEGVEAALFGLKGSELVVERAGERARAAISIRVRTF